MNSKNLKTPLASLVFSTILFLASMSTSCKKDDSAIPAGVDSIAKVSSVDKNNHAGTYIDNKPATGTTTGTVTGTKAGTTGTTVGTTTGTSTGSNTGTTNGTSAGSNTGTATGTATGTTTGTTVGAPLSYVTHAPISLSGASNQTISGYNITGGASPAITLNNCHDIHITKNLLQNSTASTAIVYLVNCYNIYVDTNLIQNGVRGVAAHSCTNNIRVVFNKILNTADPNLYNGNGGGNAIQFSNCNGTGLRIDSNLIYEPNPNIYIGDKINIYQCNGTASSYIRIWYNQIRGGSASSSGFDGIILGDVGNSSYQDCEYNTIINSGTAGIMVSGGQHMIVSNNRIFSIKRAYSAAGLMIINNSSSYGGTYEATVDINTFNNKINWTDANGNIDNAWWSSTSVSQPNGWTTNTIGAIGNSTITDSMLPNPLF
jgi:hypothetical protein